MAEKKRFTEPILIKYDEKLDKVTRWNQLGSHSEAEPTRKHKRWRRRRH